MLCAILHRWPSSWHDPRRSGSVLLQALGRHWAQRASFAFPRWPDSPFRVTGLWLWIPYALPKCCVGVFDNRQAFYKYWDFMGWLRTQGCLQWLHLAFPKALKFQAIVKIQDQGIFLSVMTWENVRIISWIGYSWVKVSRLTRSIVCSLLPG